MNASSRRRERLVVGLTGGYGSGKSTVAKMLKSLGARIIDADLIARQCLEPGSAVFRNAVRILGTGVLRPDGSLDRSAAAKAVFGDRALLARLNAAVHPEVIRRINRQLRRSERGVIVLDVPLLFEAGLTNLADVVMVVYAPRAVSIARLMRGGKQSKKAIVERIQCQLPLREKVRRADIVIDNGTTRAHTRKQIRQWWRQNNG